jgi:hypothetical protein
MAAMVASDFTSNCSKLMDRMFCCSSYWKRVQRQEQDGLAQAHRHGGERALAEKHEEQCAFLANVVMRLPAWYAADNEVRGHIAATRGAAEESLSRFAAAAARFREAGHSIDAERCDGWARRSA